MASIKQLLLSVFQKKKRPNHVNMFEEFLDSVLIVDDKYNEVEKLQQLLESKDIWVTNGGDPEELKDLKTPLKPRKLLIIDLYLREDKPLPENIGIIRQILTNAIGTNYGSYGILVWTKHDEEFKELERKIFINHDKYILPLFVVCLSKTGYLKNGNYDSIINDIEAQLIKNKPARFFMHLDVLINKGTSSALHSFYDLVKESDARNDDLIFLLNKLGVNYSGTPSGETIDLEPEVIKAFCDMLYYDITKTKINTLNLFDRELDFSGDDRLKKAAFAKLNSKLHLDFEVSGDTIFPGNIYQILEDSELFLLEKTPPDSVKILLEVTPPCDFASGHRKSARLIGGFLTPFSKEKKKQMSKLPSLYTELGELFIKGYESSQFMVFDFHYFGTISEDQLKDSTKYKLLMRIKNSLQADIIQRFSSYSSRLGIPVID